MDKLAGRHIKGYELKEHIAAGGFGAVYRAYQSTVGREVAVKVILPSQANKPDFIRRFEAEAQLIARLEHMNIVPLYDYWRDPDGAYLVMRYLRGGSLHDQIQRQGSLNIEETINLLSQVGQGLHAAHRSQIVHRDIKPGNILLDEDENAYLADFGIAKDHTIANGVTEPDSFIGSPEYLAPEQARSEPVTPLTDIYSLGVVLYEMLAGEHPFPGLEKFACIYKHLNDPLPRIATLDDRINDDVNDVIQKATAKDPRQRFNSVTEMLQALRQAAKLDVLSTPTSLVELLTPREQEVMQLIIDGRTNREIADTLVLAEATVKSYINNVYRKLRVRSRVQAIARARDLNFVVRKPKTAVNMVGDQPEPENPYKGLRAFRAADAQDFFGREKLTQKLLRRLQDQVEYRRFLAIIGPSGSGKSSAVNAGIIPALWRGDLPGSDNWYIVELVPGAHPMDELEVALFRITTDKTLNLHEQLNRDKRGLLRIADMILSDDDSELLIVIDQFEEVFTLLEDEDERVHFLNLLREAVTDKRSRIRIVVTLRADYFDRPLQYSYFGELIHTRVEAVLPLSVEELERAICEPANRAGITFEDGLVSRIVSDVNYQPGALPLLQYALSELFERRDGRRLTQEAYEEIGGTGGALAKRADEIYLEQQDTGRELIRQLFLRLVTLGEGADDTRRRVSRSELLEISSDNELMDEVIDLFASSRLLTLDHEPATRQPTVDVAHEAILREWDRLRRWLNESREDIRQERLIAHAARSWNMNDSDSSYLLTGTRLELAEKWYDTTELALTSLVHEYIEASIRQRTAEKQTEIERQAREKALEQRARAVLRALVIVFAVAAVVAGGSAFAANAERIRAEESEQEALRQASIGLASQARLDVVEGVPVRAVPLALEALEDYPYTWQAERALFSAVTANRMLLHLNGHGTGVGRAVWSPDETQLAAVSGDGTTIIWDIPSGAVRHVLEGHAGPVVDVAWSPDGSQLVTASADGTAIIWNGATGTQAFTLHHEAWVNDVEWSPDGTTIATASDDHTAAIWDAARGEEILTLSNHADEVWMAMWSPDGSLLATVSRDLTAMIWDTGSGEQLHILAGHNAFILDAEWSPDGERLVTTGVDNSTKIWDVASGEELFTLPGENRGPIHTATWSPDGARLLTVETGGNQVDGQATIWDTTTGARLQRLPGVNDLAGGAWSSDGTRVAIADEGEIIRIWNSETGELLDVLRNPGPFSGRDVLQWSQDGHQIAASYADDLVIVFDTTGPALLTIPEQIPSTSWSPDGTTFLHNDIGGPLVIADSVNGNPVMTLPAAGTVDYRWSPDGRFVATTHMDNTSHVWDTETREEVLVLKVGGPLSWSSDGSQFAIVDMSSAVAYVYDLETGERLLTLGTPVPTNSGQCWVEWSPDGTRIAGGVNSQDGNQLKIFDSASGEQVLGIDVDGFICGIDWSPDGTRLVVPSAEQGLVHVIDAETGEFLLTFGGHTGFVNGAEWSPDGNRIASAGDEATRIWDPVTGVEYGVIDVQDWQAHWSPDGTRILTVGQSGILRIWRVFPDMQSLIDYAYTCCFFRELTSAERVQFGLPER